MRLLGLDLETTGLDTANDRIMELGVVLWDSDKKYPLEMKSFFLIDRGIIERCTPETQEMMNRVCGITLPMLEEFGHPPRIVLRSLEDLCEVRGVEYIVAHNGENFDRPLLMAELNRHFPSESPLTHLPWIDTRTDIPFPQEPDSRKLKHLALDCGFINPFSHRAVFDVLTMLRVLSHYPLLDVIAYSKIPFVTIQALVEYKDRELAKARRFSWEKIGDKTYFKKWVKRIKIDQLDKEMQDCPFKIVQLEEKLHA